jgi:hypothetical protein
VAEAPRELAIEGVETPGERRGPCRLAERGGDRAGDLGEAVRIQPDVRIDVVTGAAERNAVEDVERRAVSIGHGVLHGGLEPVARVDDETRVVEMRDVAWAQLEVVGLLAGAREVDHVGAGAATCSAANASG